MRSLRGRLVLTYVVAAIVVALLGGWVFGSQLRHGLQRSLDSGLDSRAAPLVQSVQSGTSPDLTDLRLTEVVPPTVLQPTSLPVSAADVARSRHDRVSIHQGNEEARLRLLVTPVVRPDGVWVVIVGVDQEAAHDAADEVDRGLVIAGALVLVLAGLGAWLLSGAALRPVERMRAEAGLLADGDPQERLREDGPPTELARLARTFNGLLDKLHLASQRQRSFIADASHELRTPLSVLRTELELAQRPGRSVTELQEAVSHAHEEVDRLSALAENLLYLARSDSEQALVQSTNIDLVEIAEEAVRAHRAESNQHQISLTLDTPAECLLMGDRLALRRALDNLLTNALRHAPAHSTVTVAINSSNDHISLSVSDEGAGFDEEFLPHAFERFRRADSSRNSHLGGVGLGLSIVAEIATAHGGGAEAHNRSTGGAIVSLHLPRVTSSSHDQSGIVHR